MCLDHYNCDGTQGIDRPHDGDDVAGGPDHNNDCGGAGGETGGPNGQGYACGGSHHNPNSPDYDPDHDGNYGWSHCREVRRVAAEQHYACYTRAEVTWGRCTAQAAANGDFLGMFHGCDSARETSEAACDDDEQDVLRAAGCD